MVTEISTKSSAFNTHSLRLQELWDELQILQADFAISQELPIYYQSPVWHESKNILDVGCGNGHYLELLNNYFPNKDYYGVDVSGELISLAKERLTEEKFKFIACNYFSYQGMHDVVVMRLFLQHLPDPIAVINHTASLLKPGGMVFIIDSLDSIRYYYPPMPEFNSFFNTYRIHQLEKQLDRDVISNLVAKFESENNWECTINQDILIPTTINGNKDRFCRVFSLFVDMVEEIGELNYPFHSVRNDIANWKNNSGYAQIGLKLLGVKLVK